MSKYIKKFNEHSEYEGFILTEEFIKPNVSYCKLEEEVHYNPRPLPPNTNGHAYVDLGLPSGTLWATMNIGAASETDTGLYFSWGETQGYENSQIGIDKDFSWNDYEFGSSSLSKYDQDNKQILDLSDDAANINWGGDWYIPSKGLFEELLDNTTITVNSNKLICTASNGNILILPLSGYYENSEYIDENNCGYYWANSLDNWTSYSNRYATFLYYDSMDSNSPNMGTYDRCRGQSIRPVIIPRKRLSEIEKILRNLIPSEYKDEYINSIMKKAGNYYYLDSNNRDFEDNYNFKRSCYVAYYNEITEDNGYNACEF